MHFKVLHNISNIYCYLMSTDILAQDKFEFLPEAVLCKNNAGIGLMVQE